MQKKIRPIKRLKWKIHQIIRQKSQTTARRRIEGLGIYILHFEKGIWDCLKKKIKGNKREVQTLPEFGNLPITMDSRRRPWIARVHQGNGKKMEKNVKKIPSKELVTNKEPFLWHSNADCEKSLRTYEIIEHRTMLIFHFVFKIIL